MNRIKLFLSMAILPFAFVAHAQYTFNVNEEFTGSSAKVTINLENKTIVITNGDDINVRQRFYKVAVSGGTVGFSMSQQSQPTFTISTSRLSFLIHDDEILYNNPSSYEAYRFKPVNRQSFYSIYNSLVAFINGKGNNNELKNVSSSTSNRTFTVNGVSFKMIFISGGTFIMGATDEQGNSINTEKPSCQVTLSSFYIGQTEVTLELWQAVMGNNPTMHKRAKRPVDRVSWEDCHTFINKLNNLTGQCFRLPNEAEWEYAARGGKSGGPKYSGSNSIDDVAWYWENSIGKGFREVATKRPNVLGIYDMSGNVCEFCHEYVSSNQINPQGFSEGHWRLVRGGCWHDNADGCSVYDRSKLSSVDWSDTGFRLAL